MLKDILPVDPTTGSASPTSGFGPTPPATPVPGTPPPTSGFGPASPATPVTGQQPPVTPVPGPRPQRETSEMTSSGVTSAQPDTKPGRKTTRKGPNSKRIWCFDSTTTSGKYRAYEDQRQQDPLRQHSYWAAFESGTPTNSQYWAPSSYGSASPVGNLPPRADSPANTRSQDRPGYYTYASSPSAAPTSIPAAGITLPAETIAAIAELLTGKRTIASARSAESRDPH
ncbi:leucine-rich repeat extensin-like protein 5 [Fopius arisanus]|uniref:Leucine-rich repeat extensin-like protein 5 n=1 Tax=Fopius arisanus TaxID=64838 RepID=A0A9R1TM64_9HYME|nr:PREDICTED: leucine-rich repeat extensin-like protein 5 [Fopius arisanus]